MFLHALHVLAVLLGLECEFFESPVGLPEVLSGLGVAALLGVKLSLELADAGFQLGDDALASLEGGSLGLVEAGLKVLDGDFELLAQSVDVDGVLLLAAELLGQVGGGLLGLLLGVLELGDGVVHVGLHGLEVLLELALGTGEHGVGAGKLLDASGGVVELSLGGLAGSVGGLEGNAHLLQLGGEHVAAALGHVVGLAGLLAGALLVLDGGLELHDLAQVLLDLLHGLGVGAVGVVQRHLQLVDVGLELLLHAEGLLLGLGLGLQGSLHGLEGASVVLAGVLELVLLLGQTAIDLGADLRQLQLGADDLGLLLFEGGLSLLQSGLELFLLHLELAAGLVELVHGFSALSELVGEVVDLVGEDLVLALETFDVLEGLFVLGLELEELGGIAAGLLLAGLQLDGDVLALDLPVGDELVELTLLLLHGGGVGVGALDVDHEILDLAGETVLGLLEGRAFAESLLDLFLGLGQLGGQLALGLLELLGASNTFLLVLGAPHLGLGGGLGERAVKLALGFDLLLELLLDRVEISLGVLEGGSQGGLGAGLLLEGALGVLELVAQLLLQLGEGADLVLGILQLAQQIAVLGLQALLGGSQLGNEASVLLDLAVAVGQLELELLGKLLGGGLALDNAVVLLSEIQQLAGKRLLLLLQVVLELLELIDLIAHLRDGIGVLLAEGAGDGLVTDVGLLEVAAELEQLALARLVESGLSGGGAAGVLETLGQLVQLFGQIGTLLLDLGAGLALGLELLFDLLDAGGGVLDLLLGAGDGGVLILVLGDETGVFGVLALRRLLEVALHALEIVDAGEGSLELGLQLALGLVQVSAGFLLALQTVLELVQGGLELSLDLGKVVDLVLLGLEVVGGFPVVLLDLLLLAGELGDELVLLGHLVLERLDLGLLGVLLLLGLGEGSLEVLDVLLELLTFGSELLGGGRHGRVGVLLVHQAGLDLLELLLGGGLGLEGGLVLLLHVASGLALGGQSAGDLVSLGVDLNLGLLQLGLQGLTLGETVLGGSQIGAHAIVHLLETELDEEGLELAVKEPPGPVLETKVLLDVPLDALEGDLLLSLDVVGDVDEDAAGLALHLDDDLGQSTFTDLLEGGQHTRAEHDLGLSATERVSVHASGDEGLEGALLGVVGQVGEDLGSDDGVTRHEVSVGDLVGQTQHANTDTLQHAVAVKLMHDKGSVDVSRLLDLVGDDATDEVRMSRVQVGHQLHQGLSMGSGNGHHGSTLLLGAVILLSEDKGDDGVAGGGHHADDSLVDGILVLEEPASDVVSDGTGVVVDLEVSFGLALLGGLGLAERLVLAQMLAHHLLQVGLVGGLGDDALFLQHGQDTHLLLDELDGDDQIHTKVDESPLDALAFVLFLLLNKHVVVEELLEALVGVVDKELFQDVELEDLKTGDIQDTDEILPGVGRVKGVVDQQDDPIEHTGEEGLGGGGNGEADLVNVLALLDEILADLQLGLHEGVDEPVDLDLEEVSSPGHHIHTVRLGLLLATLLLPLLITNEGDGDGTLVQTILLILAEAEGIQGGVSGAHLLGVIHTGDGQHALSEEEVISRERLVAQQAHLPVFGVGVGHQLVEDMVIPFDLQLEGDTGLLQKVGLDIGGGDFGSGAEMDTDEFTESGGVVVTDGLGVTVGLKRRIGLDNLLLERTGVRALGSLGFGRLGIGAVQGVILEHLLGVLGLSGTRLAGNQGRLMLALHLQELESTVSDGVQVRRSVGTPAVSEMGSHDGSVHHQPLVGVDTDAEETRVGVDLEDLVAGPQVVEDTSLVQDGQVGHVFLLLELGGIAFQNLGLGKADASLVRLDFARISR